MTDVYIEVRRDDHCGNQMTEQATNIYFIIVKPATTIYSFIFLHRIKKSVKQFKGRASFYRLQLFATTFSFSLRDNGQTKSIVAVSINLHKFH